MPVGQKFNHDFYKFSLNKFGLSHKGVHWNSKYNQYIRFDVLTECIEDVIKESSIIDAGCGLAEYYHFLEQNQTLPLKYSGIDCEQNMIENCQVRYPHLNFKVQNILEDNLEKTDYYIASGSLNILDEDEFYHFISRCYYFSQKGFIFNFLTKDSFNKINKYDVIAYCKNLSKKVEIKELYLYNDMTIFMQK